MNEFGLNAAGGVAAAILFMNAGTNGYDAFSAVMSSPWSTEKFTADSQEAKMAYRYVKHAIVISWIYAGGGAAIVASTGGKQIAAFPIVGAAIVTIYMTWLYRQAIDRGASGKGMKAGGAANNSATGLSYFPQAVG